jgi:HD-GYP domain-containing protein (c-di-GMP phosphodiesterase class II)
MANHSTDNQTDMLQRIIAMGITLSTEPNIDRLLELILELSQSLLKADGGTLYRLTPERTLRFTIIRNHSLKIKMGGTEGSPIDLSQLKDLPLSLDGKPNDRNIAAHAAITKKIFNIEDAYHAKGFDFSGAKAFDERMQYRTQSVLAIPLIDHEDKVLGVLQFVNALNEKNERIPFSEFNKNIAQSLASQAAISLQNRLLINQLNRLFEALINLINTAIDEKSPYTGGHCMRVPELTLMLAEASHQETEGPLKEFQLTDKDRYELKIASMLHDCGKITTPVHVVDKGRKLETIFDRIALIKTRFEIAHRDLKLQYFEKIDQNPALEETLRETFKSEEAKLLDDLHFLENANVGGERMKDEDIKRIEAISKKTWVDIEGETQPLLTKEEVYNLSIVAGTLTKEERDIINYHIEATIKLLNQIPWPEHLKNVVEYAGGHHERMDGKGYPKGLTRDEMSIQARCMGIADIFEALTASDRPYKKGMPLSQSLSIMKRMKDEAHIDPDLFDVFMKHQIYLTYAKKFLQPEQIDI